MKRKILLIIVFCFASSLAPAADIYTKELKGTIIDNLSVSSQKKPSDLAEFMKTYTKSSALKPDSVASGYSIYMRGDLQKFDLASNPKIETFLKRDDSSLKVRVIVKKTDAGLHLIAIENQKPK